MGLTLSGAMRWDIRHPELVLADRFVLIAGHCAPLIYATMPVYHEALRHMLEQTGDDKYAIPGGKEFADTILPFAVLITRAGSSTSSNVPFDSG